MNTGLRFWLIVCCWLLGSPTAWASHAAGGQITYEYIGTTARPNLYRITCQLMNGCPGSFPATLGVNCRIGTSTTACTSTDPRNTTAVLLPASTLFSEFYCSAVGNACMQNLPIGYITRRYAGTVELPPAPAWTLTVDESGRPALGNIAGNTSLYLQTTLSNQLTLPDGTTQTVRSSSPLVPEQTPLAYMATVLQLNSLNFTAYDADGDSLVYRLDRPLDGCNQPSVYKPIVVNNPIILSLNPPCIAPLPPVQGLFSATFPILSFQTTGNCPIVVAGPFFTFNPRQGSFTFRPATYSPTTLADNLHVVVGSITEYRKVGGRYYAIGTVRRDMLVAVGDGANNQVPRSPVASGSTASNTAGTDSLVVEATAQTPATASFQFSDLDANQLLTLSLALPTDALYPSLYDSPSVPDVPVSISGNGTASPVLQVRLRPGAAVMGRTYRIPLRVEDNACPVKGVHHYVLVLRATGRPTATATQPVRATAALASAHPTPFTDQVTLTLPRPTGPVAALPVTDALGRVVTRLPLPPGTSPTISLTWNPPASLPAGLYLLQLPGQTLRLLRQ